MPKESLHTFHIPVMGLAYTVDSPIRVAHLGISSVISIVDDELLDKMSHFYAKTYRMPIEHINSKLPDCRALRVTTYLNLVDKIVKQKCDSFKQELVENKAALERFLAMLPTASDLKKALESFVADHFTKDKIREFLNEHFVPGAIDVNIMTKVDKDNFDKNEKLPIEFNDAHAALRGFANSNLRSSIVLSAGMNPRLYSYFEQFADFYPNTDGAFNKKIILKVSDFRSAMIQGNFLAKKGLWVSEYRIESGLNCGGHAFATDGHLLGPILEEFTQKKDQLIAGSYELMAKALVAKGMALPDRIPKLRITVQGGIGTASEHEFLLSNYKVDSVGWGSPFLLVPEATSTDKETRELLANGGESDFYLSNMSPLGVPFNTIRGTTNDRYREQRIRENKPGSSCPKKLLALHIGADGKGICTASHKYQKIKLTALEKEKANLNQAAYTKKACEITEKSCLCVGLANASYLENHLPVKGQQQGIVICPGPNLAYFDKEVSLFDMVRHIYGHHSVLREGPRPHFFIKELQLYVQHLINEVNSQGEILAGQLKKWKTFRSNLVNDIAYYKTLFLDPSFVDSERSQLLQALNHYEQQLQVIRFPEFLPV